MEHFLGLVIIVAGMAFLEVCFISNISGLHYPPSLVAMPD
jgi:hypothetical protein